jgi:hypothetical protein
MSLMHCASPVLRRRALLLACLTALPWTPASAQQPTAVDLAARARAGTLRTNGSAVTPLEDGRYRGVKVVDARAGSGEVIAWLDDVTLGDGVIELDIRGKDEFQKSFPGIAFRAASDTVLDVVYLRPFNFRATDTLRHQHAVQYVSHPQFTWDRLRKDFPEVYENPVSPEPDPNGWVHVRIVLAGKRVSVYVSDGAEPDLVVEALNERSGGRVGLYNAGDFANLLVTPAARR